MAYAPFINPPCHDRLVAAGFKRYTCNGYETFSFPDRPGAWLAYWRRISPTHAQRITIHLYADDSFAGLPADDFDLSNLDNFPLDSDPEDPIVGPASTNR